MWFSFEENDNHGCSWTLSGGWFSSVRNRLVCRTRFRLIWNSRLPTMAEDLLFSCVSFDQEPSPDVWQKYGQLITGKVAPLLLHKSHWWMNQLSIHLLFTVFSPHKHCTGTISPRSSQPALWGGDWWVHSLGCQIWRKQSISPSVVAGLLAAVIGRCCCRKR